MMMMMSGKVGAILIFCWGVCRPVLSEDTPLRGPPQVDNPILLDSYLPASMQVIAHVTDLMKYDLKPSTGQPTTTTTTTPRPTSPHRPGLFAPNRPLGPAGYHRGTSYEEYVQILQNANGQNYFDKYKNPLEEIDEENVGLRGEARALDIGDGLEGLVGKETAEVLVLANRLEEEDGDADDLERARGFVEKYEDDLKIREYLRQKKIPPTKAYVGLLSLYDLLNKESKRLGLNKYHGYSQKVLQSLSETSRGSSFDQLKFVLSTVIEKRNIRQDNIISKIKTLLKDMEQENSYLHDALRYIPPLQFTL